MVSRIKSVSKNTNKSLINNENITIDAKHSEMINHFKDQHNSIPNMKEDLKNLILEYNNKDINRKNDIEYILYRDNLREKINELKITINNISNNTDLNKYYLDVGMLLHSYYENIENSKVSDNSTNFENNLINYSNTNDYYDLDEEDNEDYENTEENDLEHENSENIEEYEEENKIKNDKKLYKDFKKNNSNKSVLEFFNNRENKIIEDDKNKDIEEIFENKKNILNTEDDKIEKNNINKNENKYTSMKISDFVKEESTFKKKNILDEYLQKIDPNYISKIKVDLNIFKCPICNIEMTIFPSDGIQICENCGMEQNILIESDKPSFKDPPMEVCYFSYKRINHYNEWLAQFQAKESTEIPNEVYEKILLEIKKERIINLEKLDTKKIRQYLKKIKLNKYYDHAAHILYQINGVQPPSMSKELEEKLRLMFKEIQAPFMEVCPKTRKNFLNYSYVLHKFVELLGLDEYKIYFPLLKDREKLHQTDMIWKKICEKLGWHFIKSI